MMHCKRGIVICFFYQKQLQYFHSLSTFCTARTGRLKIYYSRLPLPFGVAISITLSRLEYNSLWTFLEKLTGGRDFTSSTYGTFILWRKNHIVNMQYRDLTKRQSVKWLPSLLRRLFEINVQFVGCSRLGLG